MHTVLLIVKKPQAQSGQDAAAVQEEEGRWHTFLRSDKAPAIVRQPSKKQQPFPNLWQLSLSTEAFQFCDLVAWCRQCGIQFHILFLDQECNWVPGQEPKKDLPSVIQRDDS